MDNIVLKLINKVDEADSAPKLLNAVRELAAVKSIEAIPTLITVLGYNNPGAAVAAVDGLIAIGEPVITPLLEKLDGYNYGARAWAIRVLSGIGDPRGLEMLLDAAANDFALSVRRAAARGLGYICWEKMSGAKVRASQQRCLDVLSQVTDDPEWIVRYAGVVGLEGLAHSIDISDRQLICDKLGAIEKKDDCLTVRIRARWGIETILSL